MAWPPRGLEPLLLDALRRSGAREVNRAPARCDAGDRVEALFLTTPGGAGVDGRFEARVEARLRAAVPSMDLAPRWQPFDGAAWLARRGEERVRLRGGRELRIRPGVVFGDGLHPTTRRCVSVLESAVRAGSRWIDIGAGSGVLSMAAKSYGAREVVAVEMDPAGCDEIRENCRLNGILAVSVVELEVSPVRLGAVRDYAPWDGIVANVETGVLAPLLPVLGAHVVPGGCVVTSGILAPERKRVTSAAHSGGLALERAAEDDGWWTLVFRAAPE